MESTISGGIDANRPAGHPHLPSQKRRIRPRRLSDVFRTASLCLLLCWSAGDLSAAEVVLPEGDAPAPIVSGYFPNRVYEFVWRNWNAVEPAKLAKILGTSVENVNVLADSMGLPPADAIPPEMKTRGYITLIRRNWHLLPYDQLLELVEMTPERLSVRAARGRLSVD